MSTRSERYEKMCCGSETNIQYNHPAFNDVRIQQIEEDEFIANPPEVEEGVHECRCGSKKTISYTLQTQAGDEATGVWAQCVKCGAKWRA